MTIEEAIHHCEEAAAGETEQGKCPECVAEHKPKKRGRRWNGDLIDACFTARDAT